MSSNKRFRLGTLLLAVALIASACGGRVFKQPQVTLENVQIGGLGLRGGTLIVNLQVANPNPFALNADQLTYDLALADPEEQGDSAWIDFARGTHEQSFSVGSGDTATVQVPVEFTYAGLGGAANALLRNGTFSYRATGSVDVRTPLGTYAVPFRKRGTVTLLGGSD